MSRFAELIFKHAYYESGTEFFFDFQDQGSKSCFSRSGELTQFVNTLFAFCTEVRRLHMTNNLKKVTYI